MDTIKLYEIVKNNRDLWLDLTEKNYKAGRYCHPHKMQVPYKNGVFTYFAEPKTPGQAYINLLVLNNVISETNHLIDYVKAAIKVKRDKYVDSITKLIHKYEQYLDSMGGKRDENGYYTSFTYQDQRKLFPQTTGEEPDGNNNKRYARGKNRDSLYR